MQWVCKLDTKGKEHCRLVVTEELQAIVYWVPGETANDEAGWSFMINGRIDPQRRIFSTCKLARVAALYRLTDLSIHWVRRLKHFGQQPNEMEGV